MGGACSTNGRKERYVQGFGGKPKGRDNLEDLRIDEKNRRIILKWSFKK
jgi:hypothetical protein